MNVDYNEIMSGQLVKSVHSKILFLFVFKNVIATIELRSLIKMNFVGITVSCISYIKYNKVLYSINLVLNIMGMCC